MLQHRRVGGGDGVLAGLGSQPPEQAHHHQHHRQQGGRAQDGHSDTATDRHIAGPNQAVSTSSPEEGGDGGGQGGDLWREGEVAVAPASAVVHAAPATT